VFSNHATAGRSTKWESRALWRMPPEAREETRVMITFTYAGLVAADGCRYNSVEAERKSDPPVFLFIPVRA
jgi:hypothetical protein